MTQTYGEWERETAAVIAEAERQLAEKRAAEEAERQRQATEGGK